MMNIVQVYPRLPPAIDGIGDYSVTLAQGLLKHGLKTTFITYQQEQSITAIESFPVIELAEQNIEAFCKAVPEYAQTLILHYSDYPYDAKMGAPFWLVEALAKLKQERSLRLLIFFHEFPSFSLNKRCYLFPIQQQVAWQLAHLADVIFTNNAATQAQLAQRLSQSILNTSVFSNIGELSEPLPLVLRKQRLLVFGTAPRRARIYQRSLGLLGRMAQTLRVDEICDVGPPLQLKSSEIAGIPLTQLGELPAEVVSDLMADSLAGIAYSADNARLAKSGVFATYCAHGLVPIITSGTSATADGLIANTQFLAADKVPIPLDSGLLQTIASNAFHWYNSHNQLKTVELFAKQLHILNASGLISTHYS